MSVGMSAFPAQGSKTLHVSKRMRHATKGTLALRIETIPHDGRRIPRYWGEFWTSKQRQSCSLHEISYRACFKAQLPRFFIELLSAPGQLVYDPFAGRGTTVLEAALLGRRIMGNDVNPLSELLTKPRLRIPEFGDIAQRLDVIPFEAGLRADLPLDMFYHRRTESEIVSLRSYLARRKRQRTEDDIDRWIRMVATNRLTGHSPGFFSVYTLPPNQAISSSRQVKINRALKQKPEYRDVRALILRKSRSLLRAVDDQQRERLREAGASALFMTSDARHTPSIPSDSVDLTVTSPPFLNVVDYVQDNWLRCWFNGIDPAKIARRITLDRTLEQWCVSMGAVFRELQRITKPGGRVAFEVGEIRSGTLALDESIVPLGEAAGLRAEAVYVNEQEFTKTANIWGVHNNRKGTNTNRIVVFRKR
jgi:hypothetical protein